MITLGILLTLVGVVSYFRILRACKQKGEEFNPFRAGFLNYVGFIVGVGAGIVLVCGLCIKYLP